MTKFQEIQGLKSSGYISIPFSAVWSEDNFLAYVTDKGVNVVALLFSGVSKENSIGVKRWLVKPRQYFPSNDCLINVAKLGETLQPDELFKLILDKTLSPRASLSAPTIYAISIAWSPFAHPLCESSMLTILTDQGSLDLYTYGEHDWIHVACISEHWLGQCRKKWNNSEITDQSSSSILNELRNRTYRVKISAFSWGEFHDDQWFTIFTANLLGEIMQWKVKINPSGVEISNLFLFKTDLDSIGCLSALKLESDTSYMLLMGCNSGKIQCISISDSNFKAKSMVWSDVDQMPVPLNGPVGTICPEGILFVVPKMGHLLMFWLDSDANLINFFTHSTDDIAITGIIWVKESDFLVCTRSGELLNVKVSLSSNLLDAVVERADCLSKSNGSAYYGIAVSKNRCLFAIPYCVCTPHDPSVIKEPSVLGIFSNSKRFEADQILELKSDTFHCLWDYLETLRIDICNKKYVIPMNLKSMEVRDTMEIVQLKEVFWFKRLLLNSLEDSESEAYKNLEFTCNELKRAIISFYLFPRVSHFVRSDNLSDEDRESLSSSYLWLKSYCNDGLLKSYRRKAEMLVTLLNNMNLEENELCPLCDSACLPIDAALVVKCSQGHTLFRCPRTFLPIISLPYYTCDYCGEISKYGVGEFRICIICDGPLRYNKFLLRAPLES